MIASERNVCVVAVRSCVILRVAMMLASSSVGADAMVIILSSQIRLGVGHCLFLTTCKRTVTWLGMLAPEKDTSPSASAMCMLPSAKRAPETLTGRNSVVPSFMSWEPMLPPCVSERLHGTDNPDGAVPMMPILFLMGIAIFFEKISLLLTIGRWRTTCSSSSSPIKPSPGAVRIVACPII